MILKLSEIPSFLKKQIEKQISLLPKPKDNYDDFGLRFESSYLGQIGGSIINLPLELMAEYVDENTKIHVDVNDQIYFERNIGVPELSPEHFNNYNATSIGNLAYIALKCTNKTFSDKCMSHLELYQKWWMDTQFNKFKSSMN